MIYTYQKQIDSDKLTREIKLSDIGHLLVSLTVHDGNVDVEMSAELTAFDENILSLVVDSHNPADLTESLRDKVRVAMGAGDGIIAELEAENVLMNLDDNKVDSIATALVGVYRNLRNGQLKLARNKLAVVVPIPNALEQGRIDKYVLMIEEKIAEIGL